MDQLFWFWTPFAFLNLLYVAAHVSYEDEGVELLVGMGLLGFIGGPITTIIIVGSCIGSYLRSKHDVN